MKSKSLIVSFPSVASSFYVCGLSCSLKILFSLQTIYDYGALSIFVYLYLYHRTILLYLLGLVVEGGIRWGFGTACVVVASCQSCNSQVQADNIENLGYCLVVDYTGHLKIVLTEQSILI